MGNIYPALFNIVFEVFSSDLVSYPGMLCFYSAVFLIVFRFVRMDF